MAPPFELAEYEVRIGRGPAMHDARLDVLTGRSWWTPRIWSASCGPAELAYMRRAAEIMDQAFTAGLAAARLSARVRRQSGGSSTSRGAVGAFASPNTRS